MSWPTRGQCSRVVVAVSALLAVAIVAGCGSSSSTTSTAGSQSATAPAGSVAGTSATGKTTTSATTSAPQTGSASTTTGAASTPKASPSPQGHVREFTGDGNGRLGTLVVSANTLLTWNAAHPRIQIFTSKGFMLVNSSSPAGTVRLSRGTYRGVRVSSPAHWSVQLRSPSS